MDGVKNYGSLIMKLISLALVIAAGSCWAGAGVDSRPKYRDEQTLVGGAIWSQVLIPIGLLASKMVGEKMDRIVHGYFLVAGVVLLVATGLILIIGEGMSMRRRRLSAQPSTLNNVLSRPSQRYDQIYLCIGILTLLAGLFTFIDFIILLI